MRKIAVAGSLSLIVALVIALGGPTRVEATGSGHVVQPGETLYSIAYHYGMTVQELAKANGIYNPDYLQAGQRLSIPTAYHKPAPAPVQAQHAGGGSHMVAPGETLFGIAWRYGTTVSALLATNGISNPDYIYVGQTLRMPGGGHVVGKPPTKTCGRYLTVGYGDTLSAIAWNNGTTVYALASANGLGYPYMIYTGQSLHIPCGTGSPVVHHPKPAPVKDRGPKHVKPTPRPATTTRPAACARAVQIVTPHDRAKVSGTLHIVGTASVDDFQFYKLEYGPGHAPLDSQWISIGETVHRKVVDSTLGVWYVGNMPAGDYTLRLTAVFNTGQTERPCDVRLQINK